MGFEILLRQRQRKRELLRERTMAGVRQAAVALREHFAYRDLYLWGSILGPGFRLTSDVDLVVSGLDMRDFHRAHAFLMGAVGGPLDIDLKAIEDLPETVQRRVLDQGVRLG
jgi:hypothetical protein